MSPSRLEELRELFGYHWWANGKMFDATARLSAEDFDRNLGNSFPSLRTTLAHVLGADWIWLRRWQGVSPTAPPDWDVSTHAALSARWQELETEERGFVGRLTDEGLDRPVSYETLNGAPFTDPLGRLVRHVVNHATYHRGQVVTMLRQLGVAPPHTDLVLYYREQQKS